MKWLSVKFAVNILMHLHPDSDLVFSDLYRITSVTFALVVTLTMVFLVHLILNRFEATRYVIAPPKAD